MLRASPQAPIFCLERPWGQYSPNLLGLATLTSQWGWIQLRGESITQTFGEGGCFGPGKALLPSMHPCLPLQIIALQVAITHPSLTISHQGELIEGLPRSWKLNVFSRKGRGVETQPWIKPLRWGCRHPREVSGVSGCKPPGKTQNLEHWLGLNGL